MGNCKIIRELREYPNKQGRIATSKKFFFRVVNFVDLFMKFSAKARTSSAVVFKFQARKSLKFLHNTFGHLSFHFLGSWSIKGQIYHKKYSSILTKNKIK